MASIAEAVLFALIVFSLVIGLSSIIMGFVPAPNSGIKEKVEYGFLGVSALVISLLLALALTW